MASTYQHQLMQDEALIDKEVPAGDDTDALSIRTGRYAALAYRYAGYADYEGALRAKLGNDPQAIVGAFLLCSPSGPTLGQVADLLYALARNVGRGDTETDWQSIISAIEAAADAAHEEASATQRRAEDLDAPAAAASDERYSRAVDAGLIGRSHLMPEGTA